MEFIKTWQSKFRTCTEVWEECNTKAKEKKLTSDQEAQMDILFKRHKSLTEELKLLEERAETSSVASDLFHNQLLPLHQEIKLFWLKNGYSNMLLEENGRVGLKSLNGGIALPAIYEDVCLTYDDYEFFHQWLFVVKQNGKWGLVDKSLNVQIPFEYDKIFRKPGAPNYYILIKDGKQGVASIDFPGEKVDIMVPVEMEAIYHVPGWDLTLFTKDGKWGWWFPDNTAYYKNYCSPECDEIFVQPIEEVWKMEDDQDEIFIVRKGKKYYDIVYFTTK